MNVGQKVGVYRDGRMVVGRLIRKIDKKTVVVKKRDGTTFLANMKKLRVVREEVE